MRKNKNDVSVAWINMLLGKFIQLISQLFMSKSMYGTNNAHIYRNKKGEVYGGVNFV